MPQGVNCGTAVGAGEEKVVPWCLLCCVQVLTETFAWIRTAVTEFLLPAFNVKALIDWSKEGLGNANSATRTAAVQLLGTMHAFLGPALANMVSPAAGSAARSNSMQCYPPAVVQRQLTGSNFHYASRLCA